MTWFMSSQTAQTGTLVRHEHVREFLAGGVAEHGVDERDTGASRGMARRQAGPPADRSVAPAEGDDPLQRGCEIAAVPHSDDSPVGLELAAMADHVADCVGGVERSDEGP